MTQQTEDAERDEEEYDSEEEEEEEKSLTLMPGRKPGLTTITICMYLVG